MSLLRRNIVANALGQSVGVLSGIVLMPLYVRYLGAEGFGLVGFFLSVQAIAAILDLGLAATANREVSRLAATEGGAGAGRDSVRTLEVVYLLMGTLAFAILALAAGWIAGNWIKTEQLSPSVVRDCVVIAAATIGLRLVGALYYGVLRGLERQVMLNAYASGLIAVQTLGVASILVLFEPTIREFFAVQFAFAIMEILTLHHIAWRELRVIGSGPARVRMSVIRENWRFALSVNGISLFAAGIKQIDRIVISSLMSIGNLGYYSAAALASNGIGKVAVPFQTALFPRFSRLFAQQRHEELSHLFGDSVRLLSVLIGAVAAGFVFFAHDILLVWMQSREAADVAARPLSILAAAMMLNGVMTPVFSMILASGYTQISLVTNAAGFVLLVPATIHLVGRFGLSGAAMAWFGFNVAYYCLVPGRLARRWPHLSLRRFYLKDSAPFLLVSLLVFGLFSRFSQGAGPYARLGVAAAAGACCLAVGFMASQSLRRMVRSLRSSHP